MKAYHISDLRFIWCGGVAVGGESSCETREFGNGGWSNGEAFLPGSREKELRRSPKLTFTVPCKVNSPLNGSGLWVVTVELDEALREVGGEGTAELSIPLEKIVGRPLLRAPRLALKESEDPSEP